ncbi:MAG TPA: hypothetical protein VGH28_30140 [Polyangiaceae bacterium]|jgi:O-antigen/teichoic acid export membrane protein
MSAKEKIQSLTHAWYGVSVVSAILGVVMNGIGVLSLGLAGVTLAFSLFFAWLLGFLLLRKSSFTRIVLIVLSAIGVVAGTLAVPWAVYQALLGDAPLTAGLGSALAMTFSVYMNARSFRVLTDRSVKAYFA